MFLIAAALFLTGSLAVFAQTAPLRGKVELKKADGTTAPVAGALVEVYRVDIKGKLPSGKTNKSGEFTFAGVPLAKLFIAVTAPGIQPQVFPNISPGGENMVLAVYEGTGNALTEDEARSLLTGGPKAETAAAAAPQNNEEAKKAQAEYEKKLKEATERNEKIKNINQVIDKAISEGKAAMDAKNYDVAVVKYDEGFNADPEYAGTAPVFLNNKATALKLRGFESYKKASTDAANKDTLLASAKKDFADSISAFQKSLTILNGATTTDAALQKNYAGYKMVALSGAVESLRLSVGSRADVSRTGDLATALKDYVAVETDAALKAKTQLMVADTLRSAGDSVNAIPVYRTLLESNPDNADALGGLGLSLVNVASSTDPIDKDGLQEAINTLERFVQTAPETHSLKVEVKGVVSYLKNDLKLTPQKTTKPAAKKKT